MSWNGDIGLPSESAEEINKQKLHIGNKISDNMVTERRCGPVVRVTWLWCRNSPEGFEFAAGLGHMTQGSKLTIASSKFATGKSHLPPVENVVSKKLLPLNSVMKVISWKNKPNFTEITLLAIRQNTIPCGQRHYECL